MITTYYKHCITIDDNSNIIKGFTTAFEQPTSTDICISCEEDWGRQLKLEKDGTENPQLINMQGVYLYKYISGNVVAKTAEEIQTEIAAKTPTATPTSIEQRISDMEELMAAVMFGGAEQ